MATITQPLFTITDYQDYTGDMSITSGQFNMFYDMAWNFILEFCPKLAQLDDTDPNLEWLKKAIMLQINYLIINDDAINSIAKLSNVSIGDYSEAYTYGNNAVGNDALLPKRVISILINYFGCSVWLTRKSKCPPCGITGGGNCAD